MSVIDTWYDVYARALLGRTIRSALAYDLVYKALAATLLAPATAFVLSRLIVASGSVSIANGAIAGFMISLPGLVFLLLALAFSLTALYAEEAGLMHIAAGASRGRPATWTEALATTVAALPRLLHLALVQGGILLLWLAPLAAVAALTYSLLLGAHDINWYLANRPPAFQTAVAIGALLALIAAGILIRLLVDWSLTIPVCLYEDARGRAALRRSRDLVQGRRPRVLWLLLLSLGLALGASAGALWLTDTLIELMLGPIQGVGAQIAATAVALVVLLVVAALLSFLVLAVYAAVVMHLYLEILGVDGLPTRRWEHAARAGRVPGWALVAGLAVLLVLAGMIADGRLEDLRLGRDTQVTAHRGSSNYAPENTLAAIYQAISDGADVAEIDVQETADGVVVLLHDTDLMHIAGLPTKIWDARFEDLRRVDAGRWFSQEFVGEQVPTLQEALVAAGDRIGLNIELKLNGHEKRLPERVAEILRATGCGAGCVVTSLSQQAIARFRELAPEIPVGQIVTVSIGDVTRLDVDLLSMSVDKVTPSQVRANRTAGIATHVWTVNDPEQMGRMLDYGVDNIITDEPSRLRTLIDERAGHSDAELLVLSLGRQLRER
jgi:glycerophosphoryl diester phosphodiesterase